MKYGAFVGWGIVLYSVMFLVHSVLVEYGMSIGTLPRVLALLALITTATIAGRSLRFTTWRDILPYSFSWLVVVVAIDVLVSVPFTGWNIFADPNVWVGYALVVLVPLFSPYTRGRAFGVTHS